MSFRTESLNGKPVIVQTLHSNYRGADTSALLAEASNVLGELASPVYYILDLTAIDLTFPEIMLSANLATRGDTPAFHHPKVIETLVITTNSALRMAALGLQHPVFGSAKMKVFDTFDEAMAYCQ